MTSNYVLIQRITVTQATSSITFSNLPASGYTDLKLEFSGRTTRTDAQYDNLALRFNGDTSNNYTSRLLYGYSGTTTVASTNETNSYLSWHYVSDNASSTNAFGNGSVTIYNYLTSGVKKSTMSDSGSTNSNTVAITAGGNGLWSGTAAINTLTVVCGSGNILPNSTFSLYGVAAFGTTPTDPKATGGDIVTNDGTYWYHAFLSSGTFTPTETLSCDYLVIAGGGSAGGDRGGGGGAGGYRSATSQSLTATSYTVTVGAGGAANGVLAGLKGSNSSFNALISTGGGLGGSVSGTSPGTGGSGGGGYGGGSVSNPGAAGNQGGYSPVEGYAGGNGENPDPRRAGGGGGAGAAGLNGTSGGTGGAGSNSFSSWASATSTGVSGYYGGGGGGGSLTGTSSGGSGGGGGGVSSGSGSAGTANTGSGGGGGGDAGAGRSGGAGGSGIVIVRYAV